MMVVVFGITAPCFFVSFGLYSPSMRCDDRARDSACLNSERCHLSVPLSAQKRLDKRRFESSSSFILLFAAAAAAAAAAL